MQDPRDALIEELRAEVSRLRAENVSLRRLAHAGADPAPEGRQHDALWPIRQALLDSHEKTPEKEDEKSPLASAVPEAVPSATAEVAPAREVAHVSQREKIIEEIISTETNFVADLVVLQHLFRNPLYAQVREPGRPGGIMSQADFTNIFSNSETLLTLNRQFLEELQERKADWHPGSSTVGDIFIAYAPLFKLYGDFCANLPKAFSTVKTLRQNSPEFSAVLRLIERLPDLRRLQLESFLSLPMQRVPRYVLFLETLAKHTASDHPDKPLVNQALQKMRSIASEINKSVDTLERAHKIMEIKATVTGIPFELLEPSRHFVKAGQIHKITSKFVLIDQYYLFNDLLMYCGRPYGGTGSMYYKGHIPLSTAWVRDLPDSPFVKHLIQLVAPKKTYTFYWESLEEKKEWLAAIGKCIDDLVTADPNLVYKRGEIRHREPTSGFYTVLRDLFSYRPEEIDSSLYDEDLDTFQLIDEPGGEHKTVKLHDDSEDEGSSVVPTTVAVANEPMKASSSENTADTFNDFLYWSIRNEGGSPAPRQQQMKK